MSKHWPYFQVFGELPFPAPLLDWLPAIRAFGYKVVPVFDRQWSNI